MDVEQKLCDALGPWWFYAVDWETWMTSALPHRPLMITFKDPSQSGASPGKLY